jgi:hypothetical protein
MGVSPSYKIATDKVPRIVGVNETKYVPSKLSWISKLEEFEGNVKLAPPT